MNDCFQFIFTQPFWPRRNTRLKSSKINLFLILQELFEHKSPKNESRVPRMIRRESDNSSIKKCLSIWPRLQDWAYCKCGKLSTTGAHMNTVLMSPDGGYGPWKEQKEFSGMKTTLFERNGQLLHWCMWRG